TPCGPRAVPTGGAGVACPAGTCSFTIAAIGFAMSPCAPLCASTRLPVYSSMRLELQVIKLDRRGPPEQRHRHANLALVGDDLFHRAGEVGERPLGDLHDLAYQEGDQLRRLLFLGRLLDPEQPVHLVGP